jgi:hypothetical protein
MPTMMLYDDQLKPYLSLSTAINYNGHYVKRPNEEMEPVYLSTFTLS